MRFIAKGPDLPDDLLIARDQGRVVFICGAGVSLARTGLPDFWGLAEEVAKALGVQTGEHISKIIQANREAPANQLKTISADRLFGLIEQDFEIADIYAAVSTALRPKPESDLSAHKILLDLATTREGLVRIVTTNFDLLFNACDPGLPCHRPPRLPDPKRPKELHGIVHLHGSVNLDYSGAEADGFVLSSSEFGQAYLADGWATSFIKEILDNYIVVFIGYSADDPPMQYLLEALRKSPNSGKNIYAFHPCSNIDGYSQWTQKGVMPIEYDDADRHRALWETLEVWASRARSPRDWYNSVIEAAMKGPSNVSSHVRGQVAHMVSTYDGAKLFCHHTPPPPGEWISVFDPQIRFDSSQHYWQTEEQTRIKNFDKYGLDQETFTETDSADEESQLKRWGALLPSKQDYHAIKLQNLSSIGGANSSRSAEVVPRLKHLAIWVSRVCDQIPVIHWAAQQNGLHRDLCKHISYALTDTQIIYAPVVRNAWHYILESKPIINDRLYIYQINRLVNIEGWSTRLVREFASYYKPYISTGAPYIGKLKPTDDISTAKLNDLLHVEVIYQQINRPPIGVPNEWKPRVIAALRENLLHAVRLETEINSSYSYNLRNINSLYSDKSTSRERYSNLPGLSAYVSHFSIMFKELIDVDKNAALTEFRSWIIEDDTIFARLRIWAGSYKSLVTTNEFVEILLSLSNDAFWQSQHQRDLLISLSIRWGDLNPTERELIESRLLKGPANWGEDEARFQRLKAYHVLERIHWLSKNGCKLNCDIEKVTEGLKVIIPDWDVTEADKAVRPSGVRVRRINKNTDHSELSKVSIRQAKSILMAKTGRSEGFIENDPFLGLIEDRPIYAFRVLSLNAKQNDFASELWNKFLCSDARKQDSCRFVGLIAERISSYEPEHLNPLLHSISSWIADLSEDHYRASCASIVKAVSKILLTINQFSGQTKPALDIANNNQDWIMESINSPIGMVTRGMFSEPYITTNQNIPDHWWKRIKVILEMAEEIRRLAIVELNRKLNWFFHTNPDWTEHNLLPFLISDDLLTKDAAWTGLLRSAQDIEAPLFNLLKPRILNYESVRANHEQSMQLSGMVLMGWGLTDPNTDQRQISTNELIAMLIRNDDQFRVNILSSAWHWATAEESKQQWRPLLFELIRIWPRRKSIKSPNTTRQLLNIAFEEKDDFLRMKELITPLITKQNQRAIDVYQLTMDDNKLINKYPEGILDLLYIALPEDANQWPYELDSILIQLKDSNSAIRGDGRLIELIHAWQSL